MSFKWAKPIATGSQEKIVKPTCKSWYSVITQAYCMFDKKTATVIFMHNLCGKIQCYFLFMHNLPFSVKLFLFQKYFFIFFFCLFHKQNPKPEGEEKNICCWESDTSGFMLMKDKMSSSENTRLDLVHLCSLLNKNWCLLCIFSFPIPASWSTDQHFSGQDPVVNDKYWNRMLAKTSRDRPAQSLGGSGIPKPPLRNSDSRCLKGALMLSWRLW